MRKKTSFKTALLTEIKSKIKSYIISQKKLCSLKKAKNLTLKNLQKFGEKYLSVHYLLSCRPKRPKSRAFGKIENFVLF